MLIRSLGIKSAVLLAVALAGLAWPIPSFALNSSSPNSSPSRACLTRRLPFVFSPEKLSQALQDVPGLQKLVLELMRDENVPRAIKATIKRALQDRQTEVVQLTDEIRRDWNVPKDTFAFASHGEVVDHKLFWKYRDSGLTANEEMSSAVKAKFRSGRGVGVSDRPISGAHNDFVSLFHELAHIKFEAMLSKHFDRICSRLPSSLVDRDQNGAWRMNFQFRDLLHEKYAHETEVAS